MIFVAQSVAGGDILNADDGGDIARVTGFDILAFVGLDLDQTRNAFALVRARIVNRVAFRKCAGINTKEDKLADKRIAPKLEGERTKIAVVIGRRFDLFARVRVLTFRWRNIERARQIIDYRIDQVLHAFILECRTGNDRHKLVRDGLAPNTRFQQLGWDRLFFENSLRDFVVEI